MNNDLYTRTITDPEGRVYHYDPDQDIYYRRYSTESHWSAWAWVYVVVVLGAICYYLEYLN